MSSTGINKLPLQLVVSGSEPGCTANASNMTAAAFIASCFASTTAGDPVRDFTSTTNPGMIGTLPELTTLKPIVPNSSSTTLTTTISSSSSSSIADLITIDEWSQQQSRWMKSECNLLTVLALTGLFCTKTHNRVVTCSQTEYVSIDISERTGTTREGTNFPFQQWWSRYVTLVSLLASLRNSLPMSLEIGI